jgi:hypothetical protein
MIACPLKRGMRWKLFTIKQAAGIGLMKIKINGEGNRVRNIPGME